MTSARPKGQSSLTLVLIELRLEKIKGSRARREKQASNLENSNLRRTKNPNSDNVQGGLKLG